MIDVQKLIETILSELKAQQKNHFENKVYQDEPILRTAVQMADEIPTEYREMRKIARSYEAYRRSDEWVFYQQGKLMENFEDDFDYHGEFSMYYPTYQMMNDFQLRGYFSWRTKVRKGDIIQTSISFVFLYLYELLHQIGVSSAEEGFHMLRKFWTDYRALDSRIDRYMKRWLSDYVVYYGLDKSLLEEFADTAFEEALQVLLQYREHSKEKLFSALNTLSSYNLEGSKFYKQYPEDVREITWKVFDKLSEYYLKNRKNSLCEKLFGKLLSQPYTMFHSAVFYDQKRYEDYEYVINNIHKYRCKNGKWSRECFLTAKGKSQELGTILKAIDFQMRQKYDFKSSLKPGEPTKILLRIVEKEIEQYLGHKKKHTAPKIEIDISKLHGIRQAANITRERLLVEEKPEEELIGAVVNEPASVIENELGLNTVECAFLRCLVEQKDYSTIMKEAGIMLSVLVDAINEKCFDLFQDTVIIFDGDTPELIEDYIEELKGII